MKTADEMAPAAQPKVATGADEQDPMVAAYLAGESPYEIASRFGVCPRTVYNRLDAAVIPRIRLNGRRLSPDERARCADRVLELTAIESPPPDRAIALLLDVSTTLVRRLRKELKRGRSTHRGGRPKTHGDVSKPGRETEPCVVCSRPVERWPSQFDAARQRGQRRFFCSTCHPHWLRAVLLGRALVYEVAPPATLALETKLELLRRVLEIGEEYEREVREQWPRERGRRPPLAVDLAIEVLFSHGFKDLELCRLLEALIADGTLKIPGVGASRVNDRYVTLRRTKAGIRPRAA